MRFTTRNQGRLTRTLAFSNDLQKIRGMSVNAQIGETVRLTVSIVPIIRDCKILSPIWLGHTFKKHNNQAS